MQIFRCFCPWNSFSKIPSSEDLISGPLSTPLRKPHCYKYLHFVLFILTASFKFQLFCCFFVYPLFPCIVLPQQGYVENVMDPLSFWQFEFIDLATHQVQNSKRPKELCLQFPIAFGFNILTIQPNLLAGSITSRLSSFIVDLFLQLLGMLKFFLHIAIRFLSFLVNSSAALDLKRG